MLESANDAGRRRTPIPLFETGSALVAVRIQLLGGFRVVIDGRVVPETAWRLSKARGLIQMLALAPNHSLHREQIMDVFWPDLTPKAAAGNLYQVVHAARRALSAHDPTIDQPAPIIHLRQQVVVLEPPGELWTDVAAFNQAASVARGTSDVDACRKAIALYSGELLPEYPYDEWLVVRRHALRDTLVTLLFQEARLHEQGGAYSAAGAALRQLIELEPAHEQAHTDLMRIFALNGQPALALEQYRWFSELLDRDFSESPGASITRLRQEIAAGQIVAAPAAQGVVNITRTAPGNLKAPLTSFIGRLRELEDVRSLARQHRLVTLTGAGGCGKSRLAHAAASALADEFPDGVWMIELAALVEPDLVLKRAATALGITEQPERRLEETLIGSLGQRHLLIVLDNCEHLLDACASFCATILEACPRIHILATSRERLRVAGEQSWRVPSLSLPAVDASSPEQLDQSDAVQLFVERARLAQPDFAITTQTASTIAVICRRLDGIPLAIELAAARIGVLGAVQIAERLDDALRLLSAGNRSGSRRHQTLRAALDWGYGLLTEAQQQALNGLSVFAGGWTLGAAEAVLGGDGLARADVQELVLQLTERSLVQVEQAGTESRYRLLEIVRQYAHERLTQGDERDAVRRQHAAYYAHLAASTEEILRGPDQTAGLRHLDVEIENLRTALTWACAEEDATLGLQLCWGLWRYWMTRGTIAEGRRWMARVLGLPVPVDCLEIHAGVLFAAARFALFQSDDRAMDLALECLASARAIGHSHHASGALTQLGHIAMQRGEIGMARERYEESLSIRRELGEAWSIAVSLNSLGLVALEEADIGRARALFDESLTLFRVTGDSYHIANGLFNMGLVAFLAHEPASAWAFHEESLDILRRLGERPRIARGLVGLAQVSGDAGDVALARSLLVESLTIASEIGARETIMSCLEEFAVLAVAQRHPIRALRLSGAAQALRDAVGEPAQRYIVERMQAALAPVRIALTAPEQRAADATGRLMSVDEAVRFALEADRPQDR